VVSASTKGFAAPDESGNGGRGACGTSVGATDEPLTTTKTLFPPVVGFHSGSQQSVTSLKKEVRVVVHRDGDCRVTLDGSALSSW